MSTPLLFVLDGDREHVRHAQVDQDDLDRGEIVNLASVEPRSPQDVPVRAKNSSKVSLGRTFGIAIGEITYGCLYVAAAMQAWGKG